MFHRYLKILVIFVLLVGCQPQPTESVSPSPVPEEPPITYELEIIIDPSGAGSGYPKNGLYEEGEELNLRAKPENGYAFDHWSGDVSGESPETTIIMGSNKSVTAHFTRVSMLKEFELDEKSYATGQTGNILMDFDSDGDLDLILNQFDWPPPQDPQAILAYRNDGTGSFIKATREVFADTPVVTTTARDWSIEDFNGDGREDLFIADHGQDHDPIPGGQSLIFIQNESGKLIDETQARLPQQMAFTHNVATGDIDQDGDIDIYMCNIWGATQIGPRFYINDGSGFFSEDTTRIPGEMIRLERKFTASLLLDVDQDGDLDLVLGGHDNAGARDVILLNDGEGMFSYAPDENMPLRLGGPDFETVAVESADFNKDGWPDLLMSTHLGYQFDANLQLLINNDDGTFRDETFRIEQDWSVYRNPDCVGKNVGWLVQPYIVDANNDTWPDILVQGDRCLQHLLFLSDKGERFAVTENYSQFTIHDGMPPWALVPGDIDNDGNLDVVLLYTSMTQQVYLRIPSSEKPVIFSPPSTPTPIASTTPPVLSFQDEFEILPVLGIETDKTAIDQMIANILDSDPLDPCPVVHMVGEAVDAINPTYLVFISAEPEDFFLVVIHTIDSDSEPYGSALFGTILEGESGNVIVVAEYPAPEGGAPPDEFEIQVIVPGCDIFTETVSYGVSASPPASPFVGDWVSTDPGDGSSQQLSISENDGEYSVSYADEASSCGTDSSGTAIAATGTGAGTLNGNVLGVDYTFYCMTTPQSLLASLHVDYIYNETTETIKNNGTIWNRSNRVTLPPPIFRDDFDGSFNSEWTWIRAEDDQWNLTNNPGFLHVDLTHTSDAFEGGPDTLFLRWIKEENFEITTQILFEPKRNFQRVGLVVYEDRDNFVGLLRAYADVGDNPGNAIYFDNISPDAPQFGNSEYTNYPTPLSNPSEVYLKLRREGNTYTGFYSLDGRSWEMIGVHRSPIEPVSYGILIGRSDQPISAEFDFFELYSVP